MTTDLSSILIFKTNISTPEAKKRVLRLLGMYHTIEQSSVDLDDIDCVLRIVTDTFSAEQIISLIKESGFECSELE
jgi:hypothetical protein